MLKHPTGAVLVGYQSQPPSGGYVLKLERRRGIRIAACQPPSGGCVLKHNPLHNFLPDYIQPPSGGCVLKLAESRCMKPHFASRLQAAVC